MMITLILMTIFGLFILPVLAFVGVVVGLIFAIIIKILKFIFS